MNWRFHPDAADEYLEACHYYAEIDGKLGVAFTRCVENAIDDIVDRPTAWLEGTLFRAENVHVISESAEVDSARCCRAP